MKGCFILSFGRQVEEEKVSQTIYNVTVLKTKQNKKHTEKNKQKIQAYERSL